MDWCVIVACVDVRVSDVAALTLNVCFLPRSPPHSPKAGQAQYVLSVPAGADDNNNNANNNNNKNAKAAAPPLIVFCIDASGSMCVTTEVEGSFAVSVSVMVCE